MNLTPEQLKQNAAAMIAFADGKPIQYQPAEGKNWYHTPSIRHIDERPHRPAPVSVPWSAHDFPQICYLRKKTWDKETAVLVSHFIKTGVFLSNLEYVDFASLEDWEHSTDRKSWLPCVKRESGAA